MRVLIGDIIYNVNRVIHPNLEGNVLLIYVGGLDSLITCYSIECHSEKTAINIFYLILTNGYLDLNSCNVKKITFKG